MTAAAVGVKAIAVPAGGAGRCTVARNIGTPPAMAMAGDPSVMSAMAAMASATAGVPQPLLRTGADEGGAAEAAPLARPAGGKGGRPPGPSRAGAAAARWLGALAIAALVLLANFAAWRAMNPPLPAPDAPPRVAGLAYNAFQRWESPLAQRFPTREELVADLRLLASLTPRLRTYSAAEFPELPALAQQFSLRLSLGVWLDHRLANNEREIAAAAQAAREHGSVERVIAGNETQLHGKLAPAVLHAYLDRLRAGLAVPVSTAEPWHIWLRQPELAEHVDFITVHLLPYWEGVPVEAAVDETLRRYAQVQARFPDKRIVIGEIGWPSGGAAVGVARPTPAAQGLFVRSFLARAQVSGLDYYLMEAVDQPWKHATEGAVGAHWGMLDAGRQQKFELAGPLYADPYWQTKVAIASAVGLATMLPFLLVFAGMRLSARVAFAIIAQAAVSFAVLLGTLPLDNYLRLPDLAVLAVLVPALGFMAAILLTQTFEFVELFWEGSLRRHAAPRPLPAGSTPPFVSIHVPCCNEPPAMVNATIDSLLALDWPAHEILVIDNNTADPALWLPVQAHVRQRLRERAAAGSHGPALRFFHLPAHPGFKAGALNFALEQTDARAAWIAVVDADYLVRPEWLRELAGHFGDPTVGIVQAPQAHRDWHDRPLRRMMNWEYDGFFRIGMHHRHERDAIVQHGTMTLIRAAALRHAGGWDEGCICEDTELGLRLFRQGLRAVYVDRVFGTGLVPADFGAYRRQRRRWAQGAMQILRRHAGALFGDSPLRPGQRYHFVAGWLPWIGDALHLVFSLATMAWTLGYLFAPHLFGLPIALFVVPLAVFFLARLVLGPLLYWRRVPCSAAGIAGAALAGMGLSHSVARGIIAGLIGRRAVFHVTRRVAPAATAETPAPAGKRGWLADVREEAALLLGLLACIATLAMHREPGDTALAMWMLVLGMQSLPYAAALACALQSRLDSRPG
jgi:exo-beta-1,3-glucanase (GH17 family)/cellulose synthase/poly-beta-1,6-N-acetylglucosamine synthase-like glycosyltransferase